MVIKWLPVWELKKKNNKKDETWFLVCSWCIWFYDFTSSLLKTGRGDEAYSWLPQGTLWQCHLFSDLLTEKSFQPPNPSPPPIASDSKESIAKDLKCPFSEKNNAWIVGFNERSLWLLWASQATYVSLFVLWVWQSSLVIASPYKTPLHSWHHLVTFSILPSFRNCLLPLTSPPELKKYVGEHKTCLCKHECSSSQSFGAVITVRGLLSPLPCSCAFPVKQRCMTQCFNSWVNGLTGWCAHNLHHWGHSSVPDPYTQFSFP